MNVRCANCQGRHVDAAAVRACHEGRMEACGWYVERPGRWVEDPDDPSGGQYIEGGVGGCGAEAVFDERGWRCAAGHEHVNAEARRAEGWDYAEDFEEAIGMAMAGVEPVTMQGRPVTSRHSFEQVG